MQNVKCEMQNAKHPFAFHLSLCTLHFAFS